MLMFFKSFIELQQLNKRFKRVGVGLSKLDFNHRELNGVRFTPVLRKLVLFWKWFEVFMDLKCLVR